MFFTIFIFVVILGLLVFVHELGHFLTARRLGVKSEEFGFGFPPRVFGIKKINGRRRLFWGSQPIEEIKSEDTVYSLNWIPLGGFVKIKGEDGPVSDPCKPQEPDSFCGRKIWQRAIILSAGVAMNVVLCVISLSVAFMIGAPQIIDNSLSGAKITNQAIQVISVLSDSPAQKAGIMLGDIIENIDGQKFSTISAIQDYIKVKTGQKVDVSIKRFSEERKFIIEPVVLAETKSVGLGVGLVNSGIVAYPWPKAIWLGVKATGQLAVRIIEAFAIVIKNIFVGKPLGVDIAGPVGIAVMTGQVARLGFVYILQFIALLSLNLAIINFLPFPALDGGRVLFLIIEKIRGRAVNQKIEQWAHSAGFALLMILIIVVTSRDILKFKNFFINLWEKINL